MKTITGSILQHECSGTGSVFGRSSGISVVFGGKRAMTDGNRILLPTIDGNAKIDHDLQRVIRGYLDHEAGHCKHTDFLGARPYMERWRDAGDDLALGLNNALEDIRLEKLVRAEYPGSADNLRATARHVNTKFLEAYEGGEYSEAQLDDVLFIGPGAVTWRGRFGYGGRTPERCWELLGEDVQAKVEAAIEALEDCENTVDVCKLTERLVAEWREERAEAERRGRGRGEGEGEGEGGTGERVEGEAGDFADSADSDDSDDGSEGEASEAGDGDGDGSEGDEVTSKGSSEDKSDECPVAGDEVKPLGGFDPTEVIMDALKESEVLAEEGDSSVWRVIDTSGDKFFDVMDGHTYTAQKAVAKVKPDAYDELIAEMRSEIGVVRRKLERLLIAQQKRQWVGGLEEGKLDTRRMPAVLAGRTNVFKRKHDAEDLDTAVTLLIDLSGSMCEGPGSRAWGAMQAAICLAEALERTTVKYEVLGFSNNRRMPGFDRARGWNRIEYLDLPIFKGFDHALARRRKAMAGIGWSTGLNNSDADAIRLVWDRLKKRGESNKVMIVLSDGEPAAAGSGHYRQLERVVPEVMAEGCNLAAIGIQTDAPSQFYPVWAEVNKVKDLGGATLTMLAKQLLGQQRGGRVIARAA